MLRRCRTRWRRSALHAQLPAHASDEATAHRRKPAQAADSEGDTPVNQPADHNPPPRADASASATTAAATSATATTIATTAALREVVLVTGISGSGKSVALHALEDAGFFCIDNLPPELLRDLLRLEHQRLDQRVAVAVDVRSAGSLPHLLPLMQQLKQEGVSIRSVFLDASTDALVRRFSETRRPHPLSQRAVAADHGAASGRAAAGHAALDGHRALIDAIELERELLSELREVSVVLDTSQLRPTQLRLWMRDLVRARANRVTLVFESFAFKHGVPLDADYVFDVRVLPNPHYIRELRAQDGRDVAVAAYLAEQPEVGEMLDQIGTFLARWLPAFNNDQRSYLTVAIGCTGGQHRSVYLVEALAKRFAPHAITLLRHRELDARD
jgi:RNase adapter protein RapZ